jgi:hypothetical protein
MMPSLATGLFVFGGAFAFALIGMVLHVRLPDHHLDESSRDVVKLVMGLIATMAALVLSLLVASGSGSYQAQQSEVQSLSANVVILDRILQHYGPEAREPRDRLHEAIIAVHDRVWPRDGMHAVTLDPGATQHAADAFVEALQNLHPATDVQRTLQSQAMQVAQTLGQTRMLMFEQVGTSIAWPFLAILVFWLWMLFLGFGLFARFNATVTVALFVGALSVACAIFLILELNEPYQGFMRIADTPLRHALADTGR